MSMRGRGWVRALCLLACFLTAGFAVAANVNLSLDLLTHGYDSSGFKLKSVGQIDLSVDGGYKFGGQIGFSLQEEYAGSGFEASTAAVRFDRVSVSVRDLFGLPADFSFFIGQSDVLAGGSDFPAVFGTAPLGTDYRGLLYFPDLLLDTVYNGGIHAIQGTGIKLDFFPRRETTRLSLYAYEDTADAFGGALGNFSGDLRFMGSYGAFAVEAFAGGTFAPASQYGYYRAGAMMHAQANKLEVLAQVGIPKWDPSEAFGFNLFYILFEPSLHLGLFSVVPTFFIHPASYLQQDNPGETGAFDVNLNMYFGDLVKTTFRAGLESNFTILLSTGVFEVHAAPYVGFATPGALWTLRLDSRLWPFSWSGMFDAFVGVRAEL
jgi:hypothetical protein